MPLYLVNNANQLSFGRIALQQPVRVGNLLHREYFLDKNLERPVSEPRHRMLHQRIAKSSLILNFPTAQCTSFDSHSLIQQRRDINLPRYFPTTHESQENDPAIARCRVHVILEISGTNEIDNQVHSLAVCHLLQLRGPVLRAVVECGGDS